MKTSMLICSHDSAYTEHLSRVLLAKYGEIFEVGICDNSESLRGMLLDKKYDIVLVEPDIIRLVKGSGQKLTILLWTVGSEIAPEDEDVPKVLKYRRISYMVSNILSHYAEYVNTGDMYTGESGSIIAVWSPAGGVGKTSAAMAYAARESNSGNDALYLSLEHFFSISAYFSGCGKGISSLFEKLETGGEVTAMSIRRKDNASGVYYFEAPDNYDDINELGPDDIKKLIMVCAGLFRVVVIDLPCVCDNRVRTVLARADRILIVTDGSKTASEKLGIFVSQNGVFDDIAAKTALISNKGSHISIDGIAQTIYLPEIQTDDPVQVFKSLSVYSFSSEPDSFEGAAVI